MIKSHNTHPITKIFLVITLVFANFIATTPQQIHAATTCDTKMTDPTGQDSLGGQWADVNRWDAQIATAINFVANYSDTTGSCVPGNFIKSFIMEESQGLELTPQDNPYGYTGLMQVSEKTNNAEGSNCDWNNKPDFDITTTAGNLNCGIEHIARGYKTCQTWEGTAAQYISGGCAITEHSDGHETVSQYVQNIMDRWKSMGDAPPSTGGTGNTTGGSTGATSVTKSFILKLLALPAADNSYIKNEATAQIFGSTNGGSGNTTGGSGSNPGPVNPDATCPGQGPITCGTMASGCHCTAEYQANACDFSGGVCDYCQPPADAAKYAIDITNPLDGPVYIPKISVNNEVHTLTCKALEPQSGSVEPGQIIEIFSCADDKTDEAIWMQFHHSKKEYPPIVNNTYKSGDAVGRSASFVTFNSGPHVHFQMGKGAPCGYNGTEGCVEPTQYVQCN